MKVYGYYRSSAAYRLRIAMNLKDIEAEESSVRLRAGEQFAPEFLALNPQAAVPVLIDGGTTIGQSLAIIEYLDETHPEPALLPPDAPGRARVRRLAQIVACDIHPLNNLKVMNYLRDEMAQDQEAISRWYRHWVEGGLGAMEALLAASGETGRFCHGDAPTLADVCLVPQLYNARRFDCDLSAMPTILEIEAACLALDDFSDAIPEAQPDAE